MASGKIKGITIEIGGDTTKLGKAIADSEKQTRSLQGELKQVEKLLKFDPDNVELLAQRQEILTQAVAETTDKLNTLKIAQNQVERQFQDGEIDEGQYRAFQRELIKTQSELDDFKSKLDGTTDDVKDLGDTAEESSDGFTIMKGALADLVSNAIQGAISAIGDFIGSLMDLSEATEEYRTMQAKLAGSALNSGESIEFAKSQYEEFYKYLGDDQASTNAITNLMGLGTSTESLAKLAEGATSAWTAYGDSINPEALTEAISETILCSKVTGAFADTINWNAYAMQDLGTALGDNNEAVKAYKDALEEGLPVEDAFNEALAKITDEQERADVVARYLNTTFGESKKTYDELNKSVLDTNEAELALKDTQAQLGESLSPVNNALTNMKNQALEAITPLVEDLANGFMDLYNWLQKNPAVMSALTAIVIALISAFTILAGVLAIQGLINGVTKAFALLNTTLLANPIVLVIALITGLVAGFIYLWNTCDEFREFWLDLWAKIKELAKNAWDAIVKFFKDAWIKVTEIWNNAKKYFSDLWSGIKNTFSNVGPWFKSKFTEAWNAVKNVFSGWGSFFGGLWDTIKNKFSAIGTSIANAISGAVKSGINGVISSIERTINKGIGLINGAISLANKLPGVNVGHISTLSFPRLARGGIVDSPTFAEIGENGAEAIIPLENNTGWLKKVAKELDGYLPQNSAVNDRALLSKLDDIYKKLGRLQVVLDTGTLVGETIDKIDAGLADRQLLTARGV